MSRKITAIVVGSLIVLAGLGVVREAAQAAPTFGVQLAVNPMTFNGICPVQVTYSVGFKVTGPCLIKFDFIDSKNQKSATYNLSAPSAGTYQAVKTLPVTGDFSGWVAAQVTSPVSVQSNKVALDIKCHPKPSILSANLHYGGSPVPEMDVSGTNFGASQGTKNIKIDGTLISAMPGWSVLHWGDSAISLMTSGVTPWEHTYQIAVTEGNAVVSNVYAARFPYTIDSVNPPSGGYGSTVQVAVWSLPQAQDSYKLDVGGIYMDILSWSGGVITAKVHDGSPVGNQQIRMSKGTDVVSNYIPFLVLSPPFINKATWLFCNVHNSQLSISVYGANLGDSKGTKEIKIGNLPGWSAGSWSSTALEASGPFNIVPWTVTYPVTIVDGNQTVSNTLQQRFLYHIEYEGGLPHEVPAGSVLNLSVYGLPPTQGGLVFQLWNAGTAYPPFQVISWNPPYVQLRVPNTPGIQGWLDIFDGGVRASDTFVGFKVI